MMKKNLFFICVILFGIWGCSKDEEVPVQQENAKIYSQEFIVDVNEWFVDSAENKIFVYQDVSFIDASMLEQGSVSVYIKSISSEEYQQLPFVWPGGDLVETFWYGNGGIEI